MYRHLTLKIIIGALVVTLLTIFILDITREGKRDPKVYAMVFYMSNEHGKQFTYYYYVPGPQRRAVDWHQ